MDGSTETVEWRPGIPFMQDSVSALKLMLRRMLQHAMNDAYK